MLTKVHLHGSLGEKYGKLYEFDVVNAPQAAKACCANFKGFFEDFRDGHFEVRVADQVLDENMLPIHNAGRDIHFIPVVAGAKRGGGVKAIAGVALLAIATGGAAGAALPWLSGAQGIASGFAATAFTAGGFAISYGSIASTALSLLLTGVSGLLTPVAKAGNYGDRNPPDQRASSLFNGPTNRSAEGTPVPIPYGKFRVGSLVLSAGIQVEQLL